jgi:hypothetical protein
MSVRITAQDVSTSLRDRIRQQELAAQPPGFSAFISDDHEIDGERHGHHDKAQRGHRGCRAAGEPVERGPRHFHHDEQKKHEDPGGREGLVRPVAVWMILVGRLARGTQPEHPNDIRRGVGERMESVRDDADRAGRVAEHELGHRDRQVQNENANQDAIDRGVAGCQRRLSWASEWCCGLIRAFNPT